MPQSKNILLKGVSASVGIAIGRAFLLDDYDFCLIYRKIPKTAIEKEKKRFDDAVEKTRQELKEVYNKISDALGENYAHIADAHIVILDDPSMKREVYSLIGNCVNAEYALFKVIDNINRSFEAIKNEYFKERRWDVQEIGKKILANLFGKKKKNYASLKENSILVAHSLTPADTVAIREKLVKGFVTDIGGKTSHTAIIAQGLGIPAVVGLKLASSQIRTGDIVILDGNAGEIILRPSNEMLKKYQGYCDKEYEATKALRKLKNLPVETLDRHTASIFANIDNSSEVHNALNMGAKGIGLYRTEFIYFNRNTLPSEQEHFEEYSKVVKAMGEYTTTIRTMDIGGDKFAKIGFLDLEKEQNPFLGLRAIRLCLKYPDIFSAQLKGILRASVFGKTRIMYPMISSIEELRSTNKILQNVKDDLRKNNIKFDENIKIGTMIETPSAAIITDIIAKEVDFVSIGTNDLIQYTLAVDRGNESVVNIYDPGHPAILRLIKQIIDSAHKENVEVAMCGEMAGDPEYTPLLLGFGLDEFSVTPFQILKIKKSIRGASFEKLKEMSEEIMHCVDRESVLKIIAKMQKHKCKIKRS